MVEIKHFQMNLNVHVVLLNIKYPIQGLYAVK